MVTNAFVSKVKRWCSSALEREYLKMHSRDIMPAYLPMDKQVIENPYESYNLFYIKDNAVFEAVRKKELSPLSSNLSVSVFAAWVLQMCPYV